MKGYFGILWNKTTRDSALYAPMYPSTTRQDHIVIMSLSITKTQ